MAFSIIRATAMIAFFFPRRAAILSYLFLKYGSVFTAFKAHSTRIGFK